MSRSASKRHSQRGLSLLELCLALAISVVVIGLITLAIRFQLGTFEQRRDRIEQAALGRAILRQIADDLRSVVAYSPVDLEGVGTVTANAEETTGIDAETTDDPTAGEVVTVAKGAYSAAMYGDQYSIEFDMSRLPRLDEYQSIVSDDGRTAIAQIPTDVRTIAYYLAGSAPITQASAQLSAQSGLQSGLSSGGNLAMQNALLPLQGTGLVRQERDRAVATFSQGSLDLSNLSQDTGEDLLAEEVTRLEFRYFDGYQWWPDWNSDSRGGLPMAVEILVAFMDRKIDENTPTSLAAASTNPNSVPQELIYRLVVRIPTAEPLDPAEAGLGDETNLEGGATTTNSTSPTTGGF